MTAAANPDMIVATKSEYAVPVVGAAPFFPLLLAAGVPLLDAGLEPALALAPGPALALALPAPADAGDAEGVALAERPA
jgi:hypothetical protein